MVHDHPTLQLHPKRIQQRPNRRHLPFTSLDAPSNSALNDDGAFTSKQH